MAIKAYGNCEFETNLVVGSAEVNFPVTSKMDADVHLIDAGDWVPLWCSANFWNLSLGNIPFEMFMYIEMHVIFHTGNSYNQVLMDDSSIIPPRSCTWTANQGDPTLYEM